MLGLIYFSTASFGLGALLPRMRYVEFGETGMRMIFGYAILILLLFFLHVLLRIDLSTTCRTIFYLAAICAVLRGIWLRDVVRPAVLLHPGVAFIGVGVICIFANGGINYLPTTNDEITNWLGVSEIIHFVGDFVVARPGLNHAGYVPGWRLLLLAPWQFSGAVSPGMSAAAAYVPHVAVTALLFDIIVHQLRVNFSLNDTKAWLWAWAVVLLFLAAEGFGRLWPLYLLIEPPQIHFYAATFMLLITAEFAEAPRRYLFAVCGIVLAAAYLLKAAAITLVAGVGAYFLWQCISDWRQRTFELKNTLIAGSLLLLPVAIVMAAWSRFPADAGLINSPFNIFSEFLQPIPHFADMAVHLFSAVFQYTINYKFILLLAALVGMATAWMVGSSRRTIFACFVFCCVYFLARFVFHLIGFSTSPTNLRLI